MKNNLKQARSVVKEADLPFTKPKPALQTLQHILSPLEQAALLHHNKPFTYIVDGASVYISGALSQHLAKLVTQKQELLTHTIHKENLSKNIPYSLRETFDDPRIILSLAPRLRNNLCRLECYTMFAIMQKGRSYFAGEQKFSPLAMQVLDALFVNYTCGELFKKVLLYFKQVTQKFPIFQPKPVDKAFTFKISS